MLFAILFEDKVAESNLDNAEKYELKFLTFINKSANTLLFTFQCK